MDHGVQGQDTAVGQGEDGLVVAFPLLAFALVVGPGSRVRSAARRRWAGTWRA